MFKNNVSYSRYILPSERSEPATTDQIGLIETLLTDQALDALDCSEQL